MDDRNTEELYAEYLKHGPRGRLSRALFDRLQHRDQVRLATHPDELESGGMSKPAGVRDKGTQSDYSKNS